MREDDHRSGKQPDKIKIVGFMFLSRCCCAKSHAKNYLSFVPAVSKPSALPVCPARIIFRRWIWAGVFALESLTDERGGAKEKTAELNGQIFRKDKILLSGAAKKITPD
ncbi:MAG TPA: hypothetical protein VF721_18465 [Pyrinomonadaceae bacterium]|jgi:hypothetical protein